MVPPPDPEALSRQSRWTPPLLPETLTTPATTTVPVARRSSTPEPVVVTVTPTGMLMVVKLWTPGGSTTSTVGLKAPSLPSLGKGTQPPATQAPLAQRLLHRPQWASVVRVSTSQPLPGAASQSAKPAVHVATPHAPAAHAPVALAGAHDAAAAAAVGDAGAGVDLAAVGGVHVAVGEARVAGEAARPRRAGGRRVGARRARVAAAAAVGEGGLRVDLAAVGGVQVAVAEARVAGSRRRRRPSRRRGDRPRPCTRCRSGRSGPRSTRAPPRSRWTRPCRSRRSPRCR